MIKCNLAVLMAERKLSIQDVADRTGLSRTTISSLVNENGKGIQFDTMDVLCELLKVNPGELFSYNFVRYSFEFDVLSESAEVVELSDEEGNALQVTKFYDVEIQTYIRSENTVFEDDLQAEITVEADHYSNSANFRFEFINNELINFLNELPYSVSEYLVDQFFDEAHEFILYLDEAQEAKNINAKIYLDDQKSIEYYT